MVRRNEKKSRQVGEKGSFYIPRIMLRRLFSTITTSVQESFNFNYYYYYYYHYVFFVFSFLAFCFFVIYFFFSSFFLLQFVFPFFFCTGKRKAIQITEQVTGTLKKELVKVYLCLVTFWIDINLFSFVLTKNYHFFF